MNGRARRERRARAAVPRFIHEVYRQRPSRAEPLHRETRAQATVEMAVVAPVLIVLALIVYNIMMFLSATARFDRMTPDIVLAHAASPAGADDREGSVVGTVATELSEAMGSYGVEVEVTCAEEESPGVGSIFSLVGGQRTYRCVMKYVPWPGNVVLAGVDMGAPVVLEHVREVTVDPWRPGVVM